MARRTLGRVWSTPLSLTALAALTALTLSCGYTEPGEPPEEWTLAGEWQPLDATGVVINEVAWMGTTLSVDDEWLELHNSGGATVDLTGWTLRSADGTPGITLKGSVPAGGYFLLERTDDTSVPGVPAQQIYAGAMANTGETLELRNASGQLVDSTPGGAWVAGDNTAKATMERKRATVVGTDSTNWATATASYSAGRGTPAAKNSVTTGCASSTDCGSGGLCCGGACQVPTCATNADCGPTRECVNPGTCAAACQERLEAFSFSLKFPDNLLGGPEPTCARPMCAALKALIDGAATSIDFSIYGVRNQQPIVDALVAAQRRGVTVRGTVDTENADCTLFTYPQTQQLIDSLAPGSIVCDNAGGSPYSYIMHNKFFVIDGRHVWLGSANVSDSELGGEYYPNVTATLTSTKVAEVYRAEFNEMFVGQRFHTRKADDTVHRLTHWTDGTTEVGIYFSPTDDATTNAVLRLVNGAQKTLDIAMFYLTDQAIADALLAAHQRGVLIRLIIEADAASHSASKVPPLCAEDIAVKEENWGGKMHSKWAVADAAVPGAGAVVFGSMNWTSAGNVQNDENTMYVKNDAFAKAFQEDFNAKWDALVARGLPDCFNVKAESNYSSLCPGSTGGDCVNACVSGACCDGLDNDHDGFKDGADSGCVATPEDTLQTCGDGLDNDGDTYTDRLDFDCWPALGLSAENSRKKCNDKLDNDGDGYVDGNDFDCAGLAPTENTASTCADGVDNDGDGFFDGDDQGCAGVTGLPSEAPNGYGKATCADSVNNDGDSKTDCGDRDCAVLATCPGSGGGGGGGNGKPGG